MYAVEALEVLRRGSGRERDLNDVTSLRRDELQACAWRRSVPPMRSSAWENNSIREAEAETQGTRPGLKARSCDAVKPNFSAT